MATSKRWGKKFIDKRDWKTVDARLVKRGEIFLDLSFAKNWDNELMKMNENKVGALYQFPESLIKYQAVLKASHMSYRTIEGVCKKLQELAQLNDYCSYATSNRRIKKIELELQIPQDVDLRVFCDGCGFQVVEGGEYLRSKYGKKNRKWIQVVIWGDVKTKEPISYEVNIVQDSEVESAKRQLETLKANKISVVEAGGDGAFDDIELWNWMFDNGIWPNIKPDKNARDDSKSRLRNRAVKERNKVGHKRWSKRNGFGFRWPATEGIFSAIKRIFGEQIHAKSEIGMIQEVKLKFWAYQVIKRYGEA
jgi:hypothetical protein